MVFFSDQDGKQGIYNCWPKPALLFQKDTIFPFANTCANQLYIPVEKMTFVEFKYNMTYGFLNSAGFGQI